MSSFGSFTQFLPDEAATVAAGAKIGRALNTGCVVFLVGELGAGKTTFTRGALRALRHAGSVKSPTYTLCEPYDLADEAQLCHLDLYRLSNPEELEFLGIRDYVASGAILFIEWPSKGEGWLPAPDIQVALQATDTGRQLEISALTADGQDLLSRMRDGHA
ncbi:MAG: tRNA (adenosine(37)-N6)-threonylcarbamoyltransferase complex ATPase subunit type 1 TsaE [Luminiphilus sp.]|jgi:tRNA threonylcarbamoyladenosine biosynthesis protein TsaE|nr:tRNA (adenosine(37)-N6)-threonylcarbamoyltransferase complex ATPase subunit type 1 TsaE [Luminiphilus sp.]